MLNKMFVTFATAAVLTASAASGTYKVSLIDDTTVEGKQVKAGDYKIQLENNTATLKHGKETITVPAHTEQAPSKYSATQVRYVNNSIREIHIGGTTTKIVFGGQNGAGANGTE